MHTDTVTGVVTNEAGLSAPFTGTFTVADPGDEPVVVSVVVTPQPVVQGQPMTITVTASDPSGEALSYSGTIGDVALPALSAPSGRPVVFTVIAP